MITLNIKRDSQQLGTVELDSEQCAWLDLFAIANECNVPSMIKRAINFAVLPEPRNGDLQEPAGMKTP